MALYFIQQPNINNLSRNPVTFIVGTTETDLADVAVGFEIQLWDYITETWDEIYSGTQYFDSNGRSEVDLARICDAPLEYYVAKPYDLSLTTSAYIIWKKQVRLFRAVFTQTGGTPDSSHTSDSFYVWKGGVSKFINTEAVKDYINSAGDDYLFNSWGNGAYIYRSQGVFFISVTIQEYKPVPIFLRMQKHGTASTYTDFTIDDTPAIGDVLVFFIDVSELGTDIYQLDFTLYKADGLDGAPCSETHVRNFVPRKFIYARTYAFINSMGGTEVVYLPYNLVTQTEQSREVFARLASLNHNVYDVEISAESFNANQFEEHVTAIDAGAMSDTAVDFMREMTLSPLRFEVMPGAEDLKYVPVNVLTKKNVLVDFKNRAQHAVYFEIVRAVKELSFSASDSAAALSTISNDMWEGKYPPVDGVFYLLFSALDNPLEVAITTNAATMVVDWGDNTIEQLNTSLAHTYADNNMREVKFVYLLKNDITEFSITDHGQVSRIKGTLPPSLTDLVMSGQLLTAFDDVPLLLTFLDLSDNQLPVAVVNSILIALDNAGLSNGTVGLQDQTPAAAPTGAGATAVTNLVGKGWTVATD